MSNGSLKEQLQAVASQLSSEKVKKEKSGKEEVVLTTKNFPPRPEKKINKPKPQWLDYVQYGVELLKTYFPNGFKAANEVKPLKKGIKQDLVKRLSTIDTIVTEDKACMVRSLAYYVNTAAYHRNVVEGAVRVDLEGNPAGVVSAEEAQYSQERKIAKDQGKQRTKSSQPTQSSVSKDTITQ